MPDLASRGRAWSAWRLAAIQEPGPLHAFYLRLARRRGPGIAIIAVARKLAVLAWHLLNDDVDFHPSVHGRLWPAEPHLRMFFQRRCLVRVILTLIVE
ncbi:hypothetical protein BH20ACT24_BH20ACT24_06330 [soil metagenome]|nr:hypothetical protein [Actinomycetota bacterium]